MTTIRELFLIAVHGESKAERRNAFCQLREISERGVGNEREEARFALGHSQEYLQQIEKEKAA